MGSRVRPYTVMSAEERLGKAIGTLPRPAQEALRVVAEREDLPLVAGVWGEDGAGCLVANVVAAFAATPVASEGERTLDLRVLELIPELSSRDLNRLVVAWDEAALADGGTTDRQLRRLLRGALERAGAGAAHELAHR